MFRGEAKGISYFCCDCKETTDENGKKFLRVRGQCFTCTQCGHEFEAGFKREEIKSSDASSHPCDSCANQALLERTKRARSVSRSLVTKQINKLENEINNSADKTTVHEIYVQLISKYEELSTLDKEVESLINIESLEDEILTREEYRDKFIIWKIRAERYIGTVSSITFQNSVENQPQNVTPLNNTVSSVLTNQPRLPKLTLESFSGKDISSFPSFWARFKSAVDDNSNLNDVDKFSYLKSVVTSDAELAIRGLTLTPENYAKAVKILEIDSGVKN
ncbi:uncharacterized protein TNCT_23442 [Trichonephila clavata]|uniref:Uncharacterized protein n=1 Tax=Trichonephila clavata TaxID=2740835 RepID=A0A8X6HFG0_TRICU|nr:uncharacterized protein TNCT_23442 [Trichonephila clavata]